MCEQAARRPGEGKQEMAEFTKVAAFFSRPKHAIISDRFTSGEVQTNDAAAAVGLTRPAAKPSGEGGGTCGLPAATAANATSSTAAASTASCAATAPDASVAAAAMGMLGKLTRTAAKWQPEALLCKRCNPSYLIASFPNYLID